MIVNVEMDTARTIIGIIIGVRRKRIRTKRRMRRMRRKRRKMDARNQRKMIPSVIKVVDSLH
jgi:hypothetical protein